MRAKHWIDIKGDFTIVVEKSNDGQGWDAKVIGLPCGTQVTCDETPEGAVQSVGRMLQFLVGRCGSGRDEHEYTIDTVITSIGRPDIPAWGCVHCDTKTAKSAFVETVH